MLFNAFVFAFTLLFSLASFADNDCKKSDADCARSNDGTYY